MSILATEPQQQRQQAPGPLLGSPKKKNKDIHLVRHSPVLDQEVHNVKRSPVHGSDRKMEGRLIWLLKFKPRHLQFHWHLLTPGPSRCNSLSPKTSIYGAECPHFNHHSKKCI